jgi:D-beta-D-heptose 7-phosphate kinase/D-beta-D-heptose 1-phosphate adenosyltransferase
MKDLQLTNKKIFRKDQLSAQTAEWKKKGMKIVFTNGCFDILHRGHLEILNTAASFGDILVVGMNSDASVKRLKGENRPVNDEEFRCQIMASLAIVDAVCLFDEDTPLELILTIMPDVMVKGGDYSLSQIIGADDVIRNGGEVKIVPLVKGYSTSALIEAIQRL